MNDTTQTLARSQNPYPYYQRMRKLQPVSYNPDKQAWLVFRSAEVERVFIDLQPFLHRRPAAL
jgi:cytochrome P450